MVNACLQDWTEPFCAMMCPIWKQCRGRLSAFRVLYVYSSVHFHQSSIRSLQLQTEKAKWNLLPVAHSHIQTVRQHFWLGTTLFVWLFSFKSYAVCVIGVSLESTTRSDREQTVGRLRAYKLESSTARSDNKTTLVKNRWPARNRAARDCSVSQRPFLQHCPKFPPSQKRWRHIMVDSFGPTAQNRKRSNVPHLRNQPRSTLHRGSNPTSWCVQSRTHTRKIWRNYPVLGERCPRDHSRNSTLQSKQFLYRGPTLIYSIKQKNTLYSKAPATVLNASYRNNSKYLGEEKASYWRRYIFCRRYSRVHFSVSECNPSFWPQRGSNSNSSMKSRFDNWYIKPPLQMTKSVDRRF